MLPNIGVSVFSQAFVIKPVTSGRDMKLYIMIRNAKQKLKPKRTILYNSKNNVNLHLCDLTTFMIPAEDGYAIPVAYFQQHQ